MYHLIGNLKTRAMRVAWMLEELGQDYDYSPDLPGSELVMAHSPSGKVPVLLDGDVAITDSAAIITYLADKHGALTAPAGTLERARQDAALHMVLDEVDAVLWTAARHSFILPKAQRVPEVKESLRWEFARNLTRISDGLSTPWLMGEAFTVPDLMLAHCLSWAQAAQFEIPTQTLKDYHTRAKARPAFRAAVARGKA